ncbi:MAG TPA: hypothetical protein VF263_01245 [Longimicrobiaceae bacterium]
MTTPHTTETLHFRSVEDPAAAERLAAIPPPFQAGLRLRAGLWSGPPGVEERIGEAAAFARIADPAFPPGSSGDFYLRVELPAGRFAGVGSYTVLDDRVPAPGLVLAACALRLVEMPAGVAGGALVSVSLFNPRGLPGFETGSTWTLQLFR